MNSRLLSVVVAASLLAGAADARAQTGPATDDPRVNLRPGLQDAGEAISNLNLVASVARPEGFANPASPGDIMFANTDLAFQREHLFLGNFNGFQIYDVSDPTNPVLRTAVVCPGGQGDVSVFGNLLFMSVEMPNGRIDCGPQGVTEMAGPARFRGVRIFDISNLDSPEQIASVQTCRGSHTHTLVTDPNDDAHVYVYVSGTSMVRPAAELEGCSGAGPAEDPNTALFRIEVIQVPLANPQAARVVSEPRIFADRETGDIAGLWRGGRHGEGTQQTARTDQCHDITAYPAIGLAAGACSGNGILLDISDPANPVRIDEVVDPNFAYWHSATFNNDGTKVIFTDEWGGGTAARCRVTDAPEWGANAIFEIVDGRMEHASYYKLPVPQTPTENCVAHNGSLIPVPGRDIKVQAWYQGGISVFDFTDAANPVEIAFFDRGPLSATQLMLGGYWSAYWYNGHIWGAEITRGLDVFTLSPSEHLTQNEIDAAQLVRFDEFNAQHQPRMTWPAEFVVARAYLDQLRRSSGLDAGELDGLAGAIETAERMSAGEQRRSALTRLAQTVSGLEREVGMSADRVAVANRLRGLAGTLSGLAGSTR